MKSDEDESKYRIGAEEIKKQGDIYQWLDRIYRYLLKNIVDVIYIKINIKDNND